MFYRDERLALFIDGSNLYAAGPADWLRSLQQAAERAGLETTAWHVQEVR